MVEGEAGWHRRSRSGGLMRPKRKALLIRAMQLLLIARMVAAPVATPPTGVDNHSRALLIVRICAWAAHQSRVTTARRTVADDANAPTASPDPGPPRASILPLAPPVRRDSSLDRYSRRSTASPRC